MLHADRLHAGSPPGAARPDWPELATSPDAWTGRLLVLAGHVERDAFGIGGHDVRTGDGPWPRAGAVEARGVLAYDARCLCHVFHADAVRPWTP